MTIRELEILLYIHKNNKEKCDEVCNAIANNTKGTVERSSIGAILDKMGLVNNPHLNGDMDFFTRITEQLHEKLK